MGRRGETAASKEDEAGFNSFIMIHKFDETSNTSVVCVATVCYSLL